MKPLYKNLILLVFLYVLTNLGGYFFVSEKVLEIPISNILILSSFFSAISIIALVIFFRGSGRAPDSQAMHTLVAITLKFLMELILALVWFIVAKKSSFQSVFIFFVLYLTFTLVLVGIILKSLRNRSL